MSVKSSQTRSRNRNRLRHSEEAWSNGFGSAKNESGNAAQRGSMHDDDADDDDDDVVAMQLLWGVESPLPLVNVTC